MKQLFIAGNWKSNKTKSQANEWLKTWNTVTASMHIPKELTLVLCVPFTLLDFFHEYMKHNTVHFQLGAQDVSPFAEGAYTGEVHAVQIREFAQWVVVGHSERRRDFGETEELLANKVKQAHNAGLKIIYCVQDEKISAPHVDVIAYEPPWAISAVSNWKTQSPLVANDVCTQIKKKNTSKTVIYGGSANADNVHSFIDLSAIDGVFSGGASLDPSKFADLIKSAVAKA